MLSLNLNNARNLKQHLYHSYYTLLLEYIIYEIFEDKLELLKIPYSDNYYTRYQFPDKLELIKIPYSDNYYCRYQ